MGLLDDVIAGAGKYLPEIIDVAQDIFGGGNGNGRGAMVPWQGGRGPIYTAQPYDAPAGSALEAARIAGIAPFYEPRGGGVVSVRPVKQITATNPITGNIEYWEHAGRCVEFSRDRAVWMRYAKRHGFPRSRSSGRRGKRGGRR